MAYEVPFIPDSSERVVSLENDGVWQQGGTYTVTWFEYQWFFSINFVNPTSDYRFHGLYPLYPSGSGTSSYTGFTKLLFSTYSLADDFISVSDNGVHIGSYYTTWDSPNLMNDDVTFTASKGSNLGGNGPHDGIPGSTTQNLIKYLWTGTFTVAQDATPGEFLLAYLGFRWTLSYPDGTNLVTETQRVYYPINIIAADGSGGGSNPVYGFPESRRDNYDPDTVWKESTGAWLDPSALSSAGGGRYHKQLVVVSDQGKIYYGDL